MLAMQNNHFAASIKKNFPESTQTWVLAALRQEPLVWFSLQDDAFSTRAWEFLGQTPTDWTPGMLALLSLGLPARAQWYNREPVSALDSELRHQVARTFESLTKGEEIYPVDGQFEQSHPAWFSNLALPKAGLLALALRERLRLTGTWSGLKDDLEGLQGFVPAVWKAPIACLFGLIPDPAGMLLELTASGASYEMVSLATHAVLANPMPTEEQENLIQLILQAASPDIQIVLLDLLLLKRPQLARNIANWLVNQPLQMNDALFELPVMDILEQVTRTQFQIELNRIAGQLGSSLRLLDQAKQLTTSLKARFSANWAALASKSIADAEQPTGLSQAEILAEWKQAIELDKLSEAKEGISHYQTQISLALIQAGDLSEIEHWKSLFVQDANEETDQPVPLEIQAAIAKYLVEGKDYQFARQIAHKMLDVLLSDDPDNLPSGLESMYGDGSSTRMAMLNSLEPILSSLGLYEKAILVLQPLIKEQPDNHAALATMGNNYFNLGEFEMAARAYELAVILSPDNLGYRRAYSSSLEYNQEFAAALDERLSILEKSKAANIDLELVNEDKLALCSTAIEAGQVESAITICKEVISLEVSNWKAHTLLGKALSSNKNHQEAINVLSIATQLAPEQPEPWLQIAKIYNLLDMEQQAIYALQAAVQAAPLAAEVHLALGKALLDDNSLTAATASLQTAHELLQKPENQIYTHTDRNLFIKSATYLGQALRRLGHTSNALQIMEPAVQMLQKDGSDQYIELRYAFAQALLAMGENEKAIPILAQIVNAEPGDIAPYLDYGKTLVEEHENLQEAVRVLAHVHQEHPENAEALVWFADALAGNQQFSEAMQKYLQVMETDLIQDKSWQERISLGLGRTAIALAQYDTAIAALQDTIQANQRNSLAHRLLAEACWAANLDFDAWNAARTALQLDVNNPEILAWFADHTIALVDSRNTNQLNNTTIPENNPAISSGSIQPKQALTEALNAYTQAYTIINELPDMKVRLGKLYALAGNHGIACETFRQIVQMQSPGLDALQQTGENLYRLNDVPGAIIALEHARGLCQESAIPEPISLLKDLVLVYMADHQLPSAQQILQQAIDTCKDDTTLYLTLALVQKYNGQAERALETLEDGIQRSDQVINLAEMHFLSALILYEQGRLSLAFYHAQNAFITSQEVLPGELCQVTTFDIRSLAAQIAIELLEPQKAYMFLSGLPLLVEAQQLAGFNSYAAFNCYCTAAEIALDNEDIPLAAAELACAQKVRSLASGLHQSNQDQETLPSHPRLKAIQARIFLKQSDENAAQNIFDDGLSHLRQLQENSANASQELTLPVWEQTISKLYNTNPWVTFQDYPGIVNAALALYQFDQASEFAEQATKLASSKPVYALTQARCLVLKAEYSALCDDLMIIRHKPKSSKNDGQLFETVIETAEKSLWLASQEGELAVSIKNSSGDMTGLAQIQRWRCRGSAIFNPPTAVDKLQTTTSDWARWSSFTPSADNTAARLSAIRLWKAVHSNDQIANTFIDSELRVAQNFKHHPAVLQQLALLQLSTHPDEALLNAHNLVHTVRLTPISFMCAQAQALLAIVAQGTGEYHTAKEALQTALNIWPDEARWLAKLSQILLTIQPDDDSNPDFQLAIKHLEEAISLEPDYPDYYLALSDALLQSDLSKSETRTNQVIRILEKASQILPTDENIWTALAKAYHSSNDPSHIDKAIQSVEKAISLSPDKVGNGQEPQAQLLRAEFYLHKKDPQNALHRAALVMKANPGNPEALMIQVRAYEMLGQPEQALQTILMAKDTIQQSRELQIKYASLLGQCQGKDAETVALTNLAKQFPTDVDILTALVQALIATDQVDVAIQVAQTALQTAPQSGNEENLAKLHHLLGNLLTQIGQLDQAISHLNQATQMTPNYIEAYLDMGSVYQKQRQHTKAHKTYQQAIHISPHDARPYIQAAISLKEGKDYQGAESLLRKAVELSPHDVSVRKQLAAIVAINLVQNPVQAIP
jgi:tetratricopeptide (TPR) repeat protein